VVKTQISITSGIYQGPHAGTVIRFAAPDAELILAAGIYDRWSPPDGSPPIESFAIITQGASPQVLAAGHERQPLLLSRESGLTWLAKREKDGAALKDWLLGAAVVPSFCISTDRALAVGWEKRRRD